MIIGSDKTDDKSRKPKQAILNSDYEIKATLYMITNDEVITKFVDNQKCANGNRIKHRDKVTIETEAHLYSAELKGNKEPGHIKNEFKIVNILF